MQKQIIFVEGVWGSGKTSTVQNISNILRNTGIKTACLSDEDSDRNILYPDTMDMDLFLENYIKNGLFLSRDIIMIMWSCSDADCFQVYAGTGWKMNGLRKS